MSGEDLALNEKTPAVETTAGVCKECELRPVVLEQATRLVVPFRRQERELLLVFLAVVRAK